MTGMDAKNLNQQIINQYAYGYNKINLKNYEQRLHDGNKGDVYSYDALSRIKEVMFDADNPATPSAYDRKKTYHLDKVDNILKIVQNKDGVDMETLASLTDNNFKLNQYTQFDQWNMAYDQNGNTTQKGTQQFSYNFRNQLVRSVDGGSTITMKYDPLGRRIEKSGTGNTIKFYYAGNQVIEERNGSDQITKQYVYGNGIDELFRLDIYSGGVSTPYYIHTNDIGSTTAITDSTGALVERVSYDTFGLPSFTNASGQSIALSSIGNSTLFQGREYDPELNLFNYRARYYDPIIGRFLQTDPVGYKDSLNLYQSYGNNPINFTDPMGETVVISGNDNEIQELSWLLRFGMSEQEWKYIEIKNEGDEWIIDPTVIETYKGQSQKMMILKKLAMNMKKTQISFGDEVMSNGASYKLDYAFMGYTYDKKETKGEKGLFNKTVIARNAPKGAQVGTLSHELLGHAYLEIIGKKFKHEQPTEKNQTVNKYVTSIQDSAMRNFLGTIRKWKIGSDAVDLYLKRIMDNWVTDQRRQGQDPSKYYDLILQSTKDELNQRKEDFIDFLIGDWIKKWNSVNKNK